MKLKKFITICLLSMMVSLGSYVATDYGYSAYCAHNNVKYNIVLEAEGAINFLGLEIPTAWVGSGVVIDQNGVIVTARHCVENAKQIKITLSNGNSYVTTKWFSDPENDIALVIIPTKFNSCAKLGDSDSLREGVSVYNIGNSKGVYDNSINYGSVRKNNFSRIILSKTGKFVFTNLMAYAGQSGGGVYSYSKLIGIVSMGSDEEGVSFNVPVNEVKELLNEYNIIKDFYN